MKFALKIGSFFFFFFKVIVGYKSENLKSSGDLKKFFLIKKNFFIKFKK